jgi:hypothetical protein
LDTETVCALGFPPPAVVEKLRLVCDSSIAGVLVCEKIVHVAVIPPSEVVTVIVAVPSETAVTSPAVPTVATESLLLLQVTFVFVAPLGTTLAVS